MITKIINKAKDRRQTIEILLKHLRMVELPGPYHFSTSDGDLCLCGNFLTGIIARVEYINGLIIIKFREDYEDVMEKLAPYFEKSKLRFKLVYSDEGFY